VVYVVYRAVGIDAVLPLGRVGMLDPLHVHVLVYLLDQFVPHHAVIRGSVRGNRALSFFWRKRIEAVNSLRVEDFIDTVLGYQH
jgi:hypothetical protein